MLQVLRDRFQGVVTWIIIILICFSFGIWGIHNYITGGAASNTVAKVDGERISVRTFQQTYRNLKQQFQLQKKTVKDPSELDAQIKQLAITQLINNKLLTKAALRAGYRVADQAVRQVLFSLPALQVNNQFSEMRLQSIANSMGMSVSDFFNSFATDLLLQQVERVYSGTTFILPDEQKTALALLHQERDISLATLNLNQFVTKIHISPDEINRYYQAHQADFKTDEQVSIAYLDLSLDKLKQQLKPTNTQLQQFYNANRDSYTKPAQWHIAQILVKTPTKKDEKELAIVKQRAEAIYQKIHNGADFAAVAKQTSEDVASAANGGDLGFIKPAVLGSNVAEALTTVTHPGELLAPLQTPYGYLIIKVLGYHAAEVSPLSSVEESVANAWRNQEAERLFAEKNEQLADLTYSNADTLDVAAQRLNLPIEKSPFFSKKGSGEAGNLLADPRVIKAAFSDDVLRQHYNSNAIQVNDGEVIVLRLAEVKPVRQLSLTEATATIQQQLATTAAKKQADKIVDSILAAVKTEKFTKVINAHPEFTLTQQHVKRDNKTINPQLLQQIYQLTLKDPVTVFTKSDGDIVIADLTSINPGSAMPTRDQALIKDLINDRGELTYASYLAGIKLQAKISIEDATLNAVQAESSDSNGSDD